MKYMLLCCTDENKLNALSSAEHDAVMNETFAWLDQLRESGRLISTERLESVETATTVRVRDGKLSAIDGPFAETKEQLGGFFLIEAEDLDEAIRIASKFPSARLGSVEVRPVMKVDRN